jgi:cell volume regulation protein A
VLTAAAGLVAVLSNRLTERVKIPSPALVLAGAAVAVQVIPPCTRRRSRRWNG